MHLLLRLLVLLLLLASGPATADIPEGNPCAAAIRRIEAGAALPPGLLTAVAASESGRYDADRHGVVPWPWTVNSQGDGRYFATAAEAIAHVDALRRSGRRNIDVGCMQINLMHHPDAFASLEEAFEPARNVAYGAGFLQQLRDETQSWSRAVERYHTADPERGRAYREKVYARWQAAPPEPDPAPAPPLATRLARLLPETVAPARAMPAVPSPSSERRRLQPLSPRFGAGLPLPPGRIAVPQPAAARQLRPIVRQARPAPGRLVRLQPLPRRLAALAP